MIKIEKSKTADSKTCDVNSVSKDVLLESSRQHIKDVQEGLSFLSGLLRIAGATHDFTKIAHIDDFYRDFKNDFKTHDWYDLHKAQERHHLTTDDGVRDDVNLVDLLEFITDGIMAGMARSGTYRREPISDDLLRKCFDNTVSLLLNNVEVLS